VLIAHSGFAQQYVSQSLDPEDFWQRARELGDRARRYSEDLLAKAEERSQDVREKIGEVRARMDVVVRGAAALHSELASATSASTSLAKDDISEELARVFAAVLDELMVLFPAHGAARGHADRQKAVRAALDKAGAALLGVCAAHGLDEARARAHWDGVRPAIEDIVVLLGGRCTLIMRFMD
jgi:hypothetical protein